MDATKRVMIAFLDDDSEQSYAIVRCDDCARFLKEYPIAIPSVGNCTLRMGWIDMLEKAGFILPTLIAPTSTVSPSAEIDYSTLIELKVTIGANARIGIGCIISSDAIIDRDVEIANGIHVNCGVTIRKDAEK